jgi:hypothetical protein
MKELLLEGLLYPFLVILFCLAFGIPLYVCRLPDHLPARHEGEWEYQHALNARAFWGVIQDRRTP